MKVLYSRVSTLGQNPQRQLTNSKEYDYILTDFCSGSIPLFERPQGSQLKKLIEEGRKIEIHISSIDRLGRDLLSTIQVWDELTKKGIKIVCKNPNITNLTDDGKVDKFSELMMSILSTMSSYEKSLIKERQMEGIRVRREKGLYSGRRIGTKESISKTLSKQKNKVIVEYLNKGTYSYTEISKIVGCSTTTVTKINKLLNKDRTPITI
jgi:DNA invertase Pin-like site-specific DNA recombinase